ncbi:MAG: hypothetical protein ABI680_07205 [Chthoniobacteraceae bacterium]
MLNLTCPNCQTEFTFANVPAGTPVRCRNCRQSFNTPGGDGATESAKVLFSGGAGPAPSPSAPAQSKSPDTSKPVAPSSEAAPRKSPYQGPLIAETGETCPQCGLTTVKTAGGTGLTIVSFGAGIALFVLCGLAIGNAVGWVIGLFVGIVAFFALRLRSRPPAGKVCTTCGHRWS